MIDIHAFVLSLIALACLTLIGFILCQQSTSVGVQGAAVQRNIRQLFFASTGTWILALLLLTFWGLQALPHIDVSQVFMIFQLSVLSAGVCALLLVWAVRFPAVAKWSLVVALPLLTFYGLFVWQNQHVVSTVWPVTENFANSSLPLWADLIPILPWGLAALSALVLLGGRSKWVFFPLTLMALALSVFLGLYRMILPTIYWQHPVATLAVLLIGMAQLLPGDSVSFDHIRPLTIINLFRSRLSFRVGGTFVVMVIVMLEALNFFTFHASQGELLQTRSDELIEELKTVETGLSAYLKDSKQQFFAMTQDPVLERLRQDNSAYICQYLAGQHKRFGALAIYESSGVQMGAFPAKGSDTDLLDLIFPRINQSLQSVSNAVAYDVMEDRLHIMGAYLPGHNKIMIGVLSFDAFKNKLPSMSLREDTVIAVESSDSGRLLLGFVGTRDHDYLWKISELPTYRLRVATGIRMEDAFHEIRKAEITGLILLVLGTFLALLVSLSITRGMSISLRKLLVGMSIVRGGNLSYAIEVRGKDEMSSLATAFNDMAIELKKAREQVIDLERFRAVHQMSITVNHEINSPLATILMTAQLVQRTLNKLILQMNAQTAESDAAKKLMHLILILDKEAKHIRDICNKLKDIKSIETAEYLPGHEMLLIKDGAGLVKKT